MGMPVKRVPPKIVAAKWGIAANPSYSATRRETWPSSEVT
jgi:hypothetical protein